MKVKEVNIKIEEGQIGTAHAIFHEDNKIGWILSPICMIQ